MKGKRYTTKDKIRILREVDGGKSVREVCQEKNIAEQTFYRWKRAFGMMDVSEARRLKELEKENDELKKLLAEALLKIGYWKRYAKKVGNGRGEVTGTNHNLSYFPTSRNVVCMLGAGAFVR